MKKYIWSAVVIVVVVSAAATIALVVDRADARRPAALPSFTGPMAPSPAPRAPSAPPCPAGTALATLIKELDTYGPSDPQMGVGGEGPRVYSALGGISHLSVKKPACVGNWLVVAVVGHFLAADSVPADDLVVLHRTGGRWVLYINGGTDHSETYGCRSPVPAAIRTEMRCA